jgi:high affinity Mn2+ porin
VWAAAVNKAIRRGLVLVALTGGSAARAADMPPSWVKAPVGPASPWSGFYLGAHFGYAAGKSDWTATGAAGPPLRDSLNLFNGYDAFKGSGSYFSGLQAGYSHMFPSRLVLGVEADVSMPNSVVGSQTIASPAIGQAAYAHEVELSGTLRGRVGYAADHWMVYGTAGFAWSYDTFIRTQLAGTPLGSTAVPDTEETSRKVRTGWAAGAGVEVPVATNWTAKLEYLFSGFGRHGVTFPAGAQRFDSDLALHSLRLGLNYRLGRDDSKPENIFGIVAPETDIWALHGQTTYVNQYAFPFRAPYRGSNSLDPKSGRETWDVTLYGGLRLWSGAEFWINPEIDQGFGLSGTFGVAGFPSGEAYKVGESVPYTRLPRMFVRQTINLGGETQKVEAGANQFSGSQTADRLVITAGKFSVGDVFDTNKYAHDPRTDFLNWAVLDTATFDYAADAWAYTYGAAVEWYKDRWTVRAGLFDMSIVPNSSELDPRFSQFQLIGEIEHRHELWGQPGKVAVTGYLTRGRLGRYADAIQLAQAAGGPADITAVRRYTSRTGLSLNAEQQLVPDVGLFVRAGVSSTGIEPYEFTDVDRTLAAGLSLSGKLWGRPDDTVGLAGVVNGISSTHAAFFNAGGLGILIGDGQLPNSGPEQIVEMYYSFPLLSWRATLDYQYIVNPAYNRDRGPVSVIGTRLRAQF